MPSLYSAKPEPVPFAVQEGGRTTALEDRATGYIFKTQEMLCKDTLLAHSDPSLDIGIFCDGSDVGIGAVLFHRYKNGSERPIFHASKTLTETQKGCNQI